MKPSADQWRWALDSYSGKPRVDILPYRSGKFAGGKLYKALRQGHKRYRRGVNTKRCVIPDPRSIDDRPEVVDEKKCFGDWEVDTVLGKQGTGALVTLAERKSRMYLV